MRAVSEVDPKVLEQARAMERAQRAGGVPLERSRPRVPLRLRAEREDVVLAEATPEVIELRLAGLYTMGGTPASPGQTAALSRQQLEGMRSIVHKAEQRHAVTKVDADLELQALDRGLRWLDRNPRSRYVGARISDRPVELFDAARAELRKRRKAERQRHKAGRKRRR